MGIEFWIWLGVIVFSVIIEAITMDLVSIWFAVGAIVPFILAGTGVVGWEINLAIFIVVSALLIIFLRKITKKFLFRNSNQKTNLDSIIGQNFRMLSRTDFETLGSVKVNDVIWTAVGEDGQTIEKDEIVQIVSISGNKLKVKVAKNAPQKATRSKKDAYKTKKTIKEEKK